MNKPISQNIDSALLLTTSEAAKYLGVGSKTLTVWRCNKTYNIPYVKVGRCVRYRLVDLENWVQQQIVGQ